MKEIVGIQENTGPYEYQIVCNVTGVTQIARIDADKRDLADQPDCRERYPLSCIFLRKRSPDEMICTIYQDRPEICRRYHCSRC
jgi:Fe-S-cluster containining protein